jgi:hypothetical protein
MPYTPKARYLGLQEGCDGTLFPLFNLTEAVGIYPAGTTLCHDTLEELGVAVPEIPQGARADIAQATFSAKLSAFTALANRTCDNLERINASI